MRMLVLGAGGVGGYYGARLASAGKNVTFLARPARAARIAREGLKVVSPLGDLNIAARVVTQARETYDVILLACKAYDLDSALAAVAPAVGPDTLILPLLNGLRHLDVLDERVGRAHVLGGLCVIGVTLDPDGTIRHLNQMQHLAFGARSPIQTDRCVALREFLSGGGLSPVLSQSIAHDMWEKLVMLATYAGMTCLMRAPIGRIMRTDDGKALMLEFLAECEAVATVAGYRPRAQFMKETTELLTDTHSSGTASMFRDMERGERIEGDHIIGDLFARASETSVATPLLRVARARLQAYDPAEARAG